MTEIAIATVVAMVGLIPGITTLTGDSRALKRMSSLAELLDDHAEQFPANSQQRIDAVDALRRSTADYRHRIDTRPRRVAAITFLVPALILLSVQLAQAYHKHGLWGDPSRSERIQSGILAVVTSVALLAALDLPPRRNTHRGRTIPPSDPTRSDASTGIDSTNP